MVILWDESLANFSCLVRVDQLVLSFAIVFHFFLSYYSGLPPLFREALVHMCNYRVHIWSELFPSPRMKRLAMGSALVSYCRSFMHELGLWLSGRLEHCGVCEPFGFSSPYPICLLAIPLISFCKAWNIHVPLAFSLCIFESIILKKGAQTRFQLYLGLFQGIRSTLGEMGMQTFWDPLAIIRFRCFIFSPIMV